MLLAQRQTACGVSLAVHLGGLFGVGSTMSRLRTTAPAERALASTRRAAQRTHFPRDARDARGAPMGSPCPPRERAPRVHSGGDGAAAGATPGSLTALARRARRCTDPISDSPMVGRFPPPRPPIVRR